MLVDTLGLIWGLAITAADVQDRDAVPQLLRRAWENLPRLQIIWADGAYAGELVDWVHAACGWILSIVKRTEPGFVVLPKRWIVERTFAWLGRFRRLSKDYEQRTDVSETMILLAMITVMARRQGRVLITRPVSGYQ